MIHIKSTYKISENVIGKDFVKIPLLAHAGEYPPCLSSDCYPVERGPIVVIVGVIKAAFCERVYR